jgi:uncharacterized repeat protein (TIGR03803 family)
MKRYVRQIRVLALCSVMLAALAIALHAQNYTVKYNFGTKSGDPINPTYSGIVAQGRDGNLYGTTPFGGANGKGAMFKITPGGTLTVVYSFDSTDPYPYSGLTLGTDGNFYGATYSSGTPGDGTVYKITPRGTVTLLHSFTGSDGSGPFAPPIEGTDGDFYGTTTAGGASSEGTVYKITPSGKFTSLYSFDGTTGEEPIAPLVQGSDGNFYGTTEVGGMYDAGVVFKITSSGKLTAYSLDGGHGGELSFSPLVQGSDGSFYGTASAGGKKDDGAIFKITASGRVTVLHSFNGTTDGAEPFAGLVQATDGNFYGAASNGKDTPQGTIFKISPTSPYPYTVLYSFDGTTGATPWVTLVQHTNGILYGDTNSGGTGNMGCAVGTCGVFYSWDAGLGPFVSLVSVAAKVGKTIEILGQGFTGTTGVSFNGTAATFTVVSSTYLTAKVPSGATTGFVTVTTPKGTLTSNKKFRVIP